MVVASRFCGERAAAGVRVRAEPYRAITLVHCVVIIILIGT